uniref:Bcl-2 Bcl-2 homology region 1-3 domain-containing protein n=1 Tax=Oreochromis niloticus TaxID=8128 RepID=A0A669BN75_ORENI
MRGHSAAAEQKPGGVACPWRTATECTLKTCNCNNHTHVHTGMLSLQTTAAEVPMVTGVAHALFSDGIINWGRVVSLVAYGTVLLRASKSTLGPECAYEIGVSIAAYITDNHMDWLVGSDGWDGFVHTFDRVHQRPWLSTQGKLFVFGVGLGLLSKQGKLLLLGVGLGLLSVLL